MDYSELFGRLALFSLLGLVLSGFVCNYLENIEKRRVPFTKQFWREFAISVWVLIFAFGVSTWGWIIFFIIKYAGQFHE